MIPAVNPKGAQADRRRNDPLEHATRDGKRRFFDSRFGAVAVRVLPGEHYITGDPGEMIVTVLGSCVAACIRDPQRHVGGMNHFMLPESKSGMWGEVSAAMRYGNYAMEVLINDILSHGGRRDRLEIKLFGGGNIGNGNSTVGDQNARFVREYLRAEGLEWVAEDLGGPYPRRIHYFPVTGKVKRLQLKRLDDAALLREERDYRTDLNTSDVGGDVDLFD